MGVVRETNNMSDEINKEVIDTHNEHQFHNTFHSDCSTCFSENQQLKEWEKQNHEKVRKELKIPVCHCSVCSGRADIDTNRY